jgi:glycosyltransferase involved in cell wall biosynthesis
MLDDVAVVIPAFNEEATIEAVVTDALSVAAQVIVVDDGSSDATVSQLAGLPVMLLRHDSNRGKAAALTTGMQHALDLGVRGVVTMDGDGQHRACDIHKLVDAAGTAPDSVVIGSRLHDIEQFPADRLKANRIANFWISWAAGQPIEDSQSGFRYYPASFLGKVRVPHGRSRSFVFESEILIKAARMGLRIVSVPIPALYGATLQRASHFRPVADITRITLMVAWKLISWGMYPAGLWRWYRHRNDTAKLP